MLARARWPGKCCVWLLLAGVLLSGSAATHASDPGLLTEVNLWLRQADAWQLLLALLLLPLAAVPMSGVLVVVGLALPLPWALAGTLLVFALHHLIVYVMSHSRSSRWVQGKLQQRRLLPKSRDEKSLIDDCLFVLIATWTPGLSYIFKLLLVAMAGLPAARFFPLSIISQLSAALPYLILGELTEELGLVRMAIVLLIVFASIWLARLAYRKWRRLTRREVSFTEK